MGEGLSIEERSREKEKSGEGKEKGRRERREEGGREIKGKEK